MTAVLARAAAFVLDHCGLPAAPPNAIDQATASAFERYTREHLEDADGVVDLSPPGSVVSYLRYLGSNGRVLFHGSKDADLHELRTNAPGASREFDRQDAVFATHDPLWAMFFALANRPAARSIRNASWASVAAPDRRRYYLSVGLHDSSASLATPGWVYLLPADGFRRERALGGVVDTGQWVCSRPVRPLAKARVVPDDYPLLDAMRVHDADEPVLATVWRSRVRRRGSQRSP